MNNDNSVIRSLHDLGLAGWFGSVLMAAVATNRATGDAATPEAVGRVTNSVWRRWRPANTALIGAHLVGATGLLLANKGRLSAQRGVGTTSIIKTTLTGAALAASAYSGLLGKRISDAGDVALVDAVTPTENTPDDVASAARRLASLQWVIPALTGATIVLTAVQGEQQRPTRVLRGTLDRLNPAS